MLLNTFWMFTELMIFCLAPGVCINMDLLLDIKFILEAKHAISSKGHSLADTTTSSKVPILSKELSPEEPPTLTSWTNVICKVIWEGLE